jgi:nickel/cobalt transporter (NiCoT) family protein
VAVVIGCIEAPGLLADQFSLKGPVWDAIGSLNDNFGMLGYIIIGIFALSWIASLVIYRVKRLDEVQANPQT